ncbi:hypothetical protein QQ045_000617 [Rhodiola kirilowii]
MISNLMFADDSILFVRAEVDDIMRLKSTLVKYEELSGQQVNFSKSEVCVGNNVGSDKERLIRSILGMKSVAKVERYLGLPICFSRRKVDLFSFIESRIWKKVNGWKEKFLSAAGKEILIKSVIQSIPIYAMSCFKFSVGLNKRLFSLVAKYWWNDAKEKSYITWVSKDKICRPKEEGGMAFKPFELVNDALLVKQAGRILSCPDLLISKVYKARSYTGVVESVGAGVSEGHKGALDAEGVALEQVMQEAVKKEWRMAVFVTDNLEIFQLMLKGLPPGKSVSGWFSACKSLMECNQE